MTFCNQVLPLHGHARLFRRGKEKGGYTCSLVEVFSPIKSSAVDCRSPCESSSTPAQDLIPKRMNSSNNSSSTLFGSNVGSSRTENTPQRQNLPQHFTDSMKSQLDVKSLKSDLITCDSTVNPKELSGNTVTPERINLPVPDATHKQDESKYDFLSVPLFNRDLLRSTVPNSANLTNEIEVGCADKSPKSQVFGDSIVWVPKNRDEWDECAPELAGLCASAGQRRARALKRNSPAPLPLIYIRDRLDIDDPLRGFQIRHKTGGWLQGFILTTTFTTWTHYFRWDSKHPKSGMTASPSPGQKNKWDDGSLSTELESQPRSGDPVGGVVWSTVAEISLVGGLGCGEYLLRMVMGDISRLGCYQYVVLQATDFSRSFYEKFGFKRVGCVTRYGTHPHLVGYRHWTYADEKNLNVHGGPSYMMAIRVKDFNLKNPHNEKETFLDFVSKFTVDKKPKIQPLAAAPRPLSQSISRIPSSSKKRKNDGSKSSETGNRIVRVVSYCHESEKDGIFRSSNSVGSASIVQPTSKKSKTNSIKEDTVTGGINKNVWFVTKPNMIVEDKQKRKPPRSRERSDSNGNQVIVKVGPSSNTNLTVQHDPNFLRKQKFTISQRVRNKPIFYNKVVARKNTQRTIDSFFFVIHFDAECGTLRLVKLEPRGKFFKGKREGRVKWKAILDSKKGITSGDNKYDWTVSASEWEIVQSVMVTKTTIVADESWDIVDSNTAMQ